MTTPTPDQAPEMCSVAFEYNDGSEIVYSHPRSALDAMDPGSKSLFLRSIGKFVNTMQQGQVPDEEDLSRLMSIEGASLILPEVHGNIELQTFLGTITLAGNPEDLAHYRRPEGE